MVKSLPHSPRLSWGWLLCHARLTEGTPWGTRHWHTDAPAPPGHRHPLPAGPIASHKGTKLTRILLRCLFYRWYPLVEGGHGGAIPGGEMLLAKPFFWRGFIYLARSCWPLGLMLRSSIDPAHKMVPPKLPALCQSLQS